MTQLSPYSKSIAATVGLLALFAKSYFNITIDGTTTDQITNGIIAVGTIYSVFKFRNK